MTRKRLSDILATGSFDLTPYEDLYKHFHAHPELSSKQRPHLKRLLPISTHIGGWICSRAAKWTVKDRPPVGGHGCTSGQGSLSGNYSSSICQYRHHVWYKRHWETGDHACGHDMHVTCLLAGSLDAGTYPTRMERDVDRAIPARWRTRWRCTGNGWRWLYSKIPTLNDVFGQHMMRMRAGTVGLRLGTIMAAADSLNITLYGRGGHASVPHQTVDPVLLAANVVVRMLASTTVIHAN